MITVEENELLTRVGPGTPMGTLQRRYWHAVGAVEEMAGRWTKRVRLLGEDLVLFKDRTGAFGLIGEFCPHRRASLAYGIPTEDGIRCPYHGWKFDGTGKCLEQPNEPAGSAFRDKISTAGYPVETLGGFIFAYLGPLPAPLLPRWDGFVGERLIRQIGWAPIACNWLQAMENSLDPVHTEWLHGKLQEFVEEKQGNTYTNSRKHLKIDFAEFEYGIYKRRLLAGSSEDSDDWKVGHPILFPNILAVGSGGGKVWKFHAYQLRVPVDDEHTMHYWYNVYEPPAGTDVPPHLLERIPFYEMGVRDETGEYMLDLIDVQDVMAWETQGPIARRELERLGTTDAGVIMFRNMLKRELGKVERGEDPIGVIRDPAKNEVIHFPLERDKVHFMDGFATQVRRSVLRFSPFAQDLCDIFATYSAERLHRELPKVSRSQMLASAAAALALRPRSARAQTLEKIRVAGVATDDTTPVYFAIRNGLYQKAGLDVEQVPTTSGTVATEAVLTGTYELGKGSPIAFLLAHLRGLPLTLIGNSNVWNPRSPISLMLVPADSTVKSGADLNGLVLSSTALNDFNQLAMSAWIDKTGGDTKTIKWIEIPNSAAGNALAEHRTAATMLQEPQLTAALETGKVRVLAPAYSAIGARIVSGVYFAQSEWAAKHAATIKKWLKVTYEAAAYTNAHHADTAPMMAEVTKIPLDVILKISRNTAATNGDPSYLQPVIDTAVKYKNISRGFPAKEAYFTG